MSAVRAVHAQGFTKTLGLLSTPSRAPPPIASIAARGGVRRNVGDLQGCVNRRGSPVPRGDLGQTGCTPPASRLMRTNVDA